MKNLLQRAFGALIGIQRRRAQTALEQLDEHTLRDIGLENDADRVRRRALRDNLRFRGYYY